MSDSDIVKGNTKKKPKHIPLPADVITHAGPQRMKLKINIFNNEFRHERIKKTGEYNNVTDIDGAIMA